MEGSYEFGVVYAEDAGVGLEVDAGGLLDNLEASDGYIRLVGKTKAD